MAKYISRGSVIVDAYVVTEQEGKLQVQLDGGGFELLHAGDALISAGGAASFVIRGRLFAALFELQGVGGDLLEPAGPDDGRDGPNGPSGPPQQTEAEG
jgi:hypothetical protein